MPKEAMETRPALILANLRRVATHAARRGQKLDAQHVLDLIGGKKA